MTTKSDKLNDLKRWDHGVYEFDITRVSRENNPWLENYGFDRLTYTPEQHHR